MPYYANLVDLTEIDPVGRMIVSRWVDKAAVRTIDSNRVDGDYVLIRGDDGIDGEQAEARADILSDKFDVRVEHRVNA